MTSLEYFFNFHRKVIGIKYTFSKKPFKSGSPGGTIGCKCKLKCDEPT
jgi:hypothetical protein